MSPSILGVASGDVQRAPFAQREIQTQSWRDVASGPAIVRRADAQVPREPREVAALRVGGRGHLVPIVAAALVVPFGIEDQRAASADVNGDRGQQGQAALVVVEPALEPFRRRDDAVPDAPARRQRPGEIGRQPAEPGAAAARAELVAGNWKRLLQHHVDEGPGTAVSIQHRGRSAKILDAVDCDWFPNAPRIGAQPVSPEIVEADWKPAGERRPPLIHRGEANGVIVGLGDVDRPHVVERTPVDDADAPRCFQERRLDLRRDGRVARGLVRVARHHDGFATDDEAAPDFLNARGCRPAVSLVPAATRALASWASTDAWDEPATASPPGPRRPAVCDTEFIGRLASRTSARLPFDSRSDILDC